MGKQASLTPLPIGLPIKVIWTKLLQTAIWAIKCEMLALSICQRITSVSLSLFLFTKNNIEVTAPTDWEVDELPFLKRVVSWTKFWFYATSLDTWKPPIPHKLRHLDVAQWSSGWSFIMPVLSSKLYSCSISRYKYWKSYTKAPVQQKKDEFHCKS